MDEFVFTRTFNAPRELVYAAWTEPDRLAKWFGPKGFTLVNSELDLRPGGSFHYGMKAPSGDIMWGLWVYREVNSPERLVFVSSFSDPNRNLTRHPMAPNWPLETLSTVDFTDDGGKTTVKLTGAAINSTDEEREIFLNSFKSMEGGWGGTFDQLDEYLATQH